MVVAVTGLGERVVDGGGDTRKRGVLCYKEGGDY